MKKIVRNLLFTLVCFASFLVLVGCGEVKLTFEKTEFAATVGDSLTLKPVIEGTKDLITYTVDKEGIVEIEGNTISCVGAGKVTITASLKGAIDVLITVDVKEAHSHVYDKEVVDEKFLKSEATCTAKAVYYKSCSCGEKGEETFEAGELKAHVFDQEVADAKYLKSEATEEAKAVYYKSCVCGEHGEETFEYGEKLPHVHVFDKEVALEKYLKSEATEEAKAQYYKSCVCGEHGEETFEYGEKLPLTVKSIEIVNKFDKAFFGDEITLEVKVLPEGAEAQLVWETSDSEVTVENFLLSVYGFGEITVTVRCGDLSDSFTFVAIDMVSGVTVTSNGDIVNIGEKIAINVEIFPDTAMQEYELTISPEDLVVLNDDNTFTAVKSGVVTFTAKALDGSDVVGNVSVRIRDLVTEIKVEGEKTMMEGKNQKLKTTFTPSPSSAYILTDVVWTSSDDSIATVDEAGLVTALKAGLVTITATSVDSGKVSGSFDITIKEAPKASDNVYLSDDVAQMEAGAGITVNGITFVVGETAFSSALDAITASTKTVYVGKFNFGAFTLEKSGLSFIGNAIDSQITGKFELAEGVSNLLFENMIITGAGQIFGVGDNENIIINKCNCDNNSADGSQGTIFMSGNAKNLVVTNTTFRNGTCARSIRNEKELEGLKVDNCIFAGSGLYDPIRSQGIIYGNVSVTNCVFDGSSQSGIMFMHHRSGKFVFTNNVFTNIACTAIDIRTTDGVPCESTFEIMYNTFDNTAKYSESWDETTSWGCIRFRQVDYTLETLTFKANYNKFINWGTTILNNAGNTSNLVYANFDYNYYTTEVTSENFDGVALTFANTFASEEELDKVLVYKDINASGDDTLVVGENELVIKDKFATLQEALAAAVDGSTIILLPGVHTGDVVVDKDNITIKTLNAESNPNSTDARLEEACYEGKITMAAKIENFVIKGVKFVGEAKILNSKGTAGTANATTSNINGFRFENNIVELKQSGKGFMEFVAASSCYAHDVQIVNNYFTALEGNSAENGLFLDNTYDLVLEGNVFENINGNALYVNDTTKGLSGQFSKINSNFFKKVTGTAIHINWMSALPNGTDTAYVEIQNNAFEEIGNNAIYVGKPNNSDKYVSIKIMFNKFTKVNTGIYLERVQDVYNMSAKYNVFNDEPTSYYYFNNSKNSSTSAPAALDATYNVFKTAINAAKFSELVNYDPAAGSIDEIPSFDDSASEIAIKEVQLFVGDEKQLEIIYTPANTVNTGVEWSSSDETVVKIDKTGKVTCLKAGKVTITAVYTKNTKVTTSMEFEVKDFKAVEVRYASNSIIKAGETLQLNSKLINCEGTIVYTSLNPEVATVDQNGLVTAVKDGQAKIEVTIEGTDIKSIVGLTVADLSSYSELMQMLAGYNNANVLLQEVDYIGYESGYEKSPHDVYGSVNAYYAGEMFEITKNYIPTTNPNYTSDKMQSLEFIVVHDTGAASPGSTAKANSNWCTNPTNNGSSWHYTVGNDGIFQQADDDVITWHAGDGTSWGTTTVLRDSGVAFEGYRPEVTIGNDGYFYINGKKTLVESPRDANGNVVTKTNEVGFAVFKGENGNYLIPTAWVGSGYGNTVNARGGNLNGIGIESAVNTGSDVYFTWQQLAKLTSSLLVKHNLDIDRLLFHNNFSNKTCPNTMMTNGLTDVFLRMAEAEYNVLKDYSDYKIEFISDNPDVIDNTGRVVNRPDQTISVSYTIRLTKGETVEELVMNVVVPGTKTL